MFKKDVTGNAEASKERTSGSENLIKEFNKSHSDKNSDEVKSITWHSNIEFLLSAVGFAAERVEISIHLLKKWWRFVQFVLFEKQVSVDLFTDKHYNSALHLL